MNLIQLIACIGLITGCFVLLHISPMDFTEGVFRRITSKPKSIRSEVNESTRRKKKSFLRREIEETQTILRMTGRAAKFPMVCALSLLLFLVGAAFALTLGNLFLVPVLAVGMMFVPFWFIRLTANHYKKNIAAELETALSIITTAYDEEWAAEDNKFRSITSFTASRASLRELRDYLADTLKYARIRAERQIKAGELPGGWFDPKDWDGWQKHMEGLIHRLDGVLALEGSTLELAHPPAPTVPELTM